MINSTFKIVIHPIQDCYSLANIKVSFFLILLHALILFTPSPI